MKKKMLITFAFALIFIFFVSSNKIKATETINTYDGELGYSYASSSTEFRLWSSSASEILVVIDGMDEPITMTKHSNNEWIGIAGGNLSGYEYSYTIKYSDGTVYENVLDPYGKYLNSTSSRNVIYNDSVVSFDEWYNMTTNLNIKDKNKIIYGVNVESFSNSTSWNGAEANRGKLLALNQSGTTYNNVSTGYDHVRNLGVTYIELSNLFDNSNPFVVNPDYVSGEYGYSGKLELKKVVSSYYYSNIGSIVSFDFMDLNDEFMLNLNKIDRVYYSSTSLDLSKTMLKKYVKDVIIYWADEYKLSGVKFENMSNLDVALVNEISTELRLLNENIIVYGDGSYSEIDNNKAGENNLSSLNNVKMMNGSLNYGLIGNVNTKEEKGILDGDYNDKVIETLKFSFLSSVDNGEIDYSLVNGISYKNYWGNKSSYQLVNYLGTREGLSVYDKLIINNMTSKNIIRQKMVLAFGTLMISGGIPYIEAGSEFLASYRNLNINNREDSICTGEDNNAFCFFINSENKILDWSFAYDNSETIDVFKSLTNFRKRDTETIQTNADLIKRNVDIYIGEEGVFGYVRNYPNAYVKETEKIVVLFNYSNQEYSIDDFGGEGWKKSYQHNYSNRDGKIVNMKGYSIYIGTKEMPPKVNQWVMLALVLGVIGLLYYFNIFMNKKLVEKRGYDINEVSRKYRPFIKKKTEDNSKESNVNDKENTENDKKE